MPGLLGLPDEYFAGFVKAGEALWGAFARQYSGQTEGPRGDQALPKESLARLGDASDVHARYWQQQLALYAAMLTRSPEPASVSPDRRFAGKAWESSPYHQWLKQSYLLHSRLLGDLVELTDTDQATKHRLRFFTRQFIDSASPANFLLTNPDAMQAAVSSQGDTLLAGLHNLLGDLRKGKVSITDETAFEVGRNVATSSGAVVFENELFQLLQYEPLTQEVATRPLLIVPPCINKFYILDLQPQNSFVRFAVESGFTVFLVSWRNAGTGLERTTWDDYIEQGALRALQVAKQITRADKVNAVGWCVGGTILASALAVHRARRHDDVASLTLLTTMLDFSDPGDLGVFIDEQGVAAREQAIGSGGIYPGSELAFVFQTLRANDLIWPYVVKNYLKGESPEAFDLLYWNADSTNLPGPMYCWYLRNMYLENRLRMPGRLSMCGVAVDIGKVDMPAYVLATQEDHIVPWRSAFESVGLLGGEAQFVLGASGHIAGVINPASRNRRSYWIDGTAAAGADGWLTSAREQQGSWWLHWLPWVKAHAGKSRAAPKTLGDSSFRPVEPAPGRYVRERSR